jgi:hypothetical protein
MWSLLLAVLCTGLLTIVAIFLFRVRAEVESTPATSHADFDHC